jgi:hypothetical protein
VLLIRFLSPLPETSLVRTVSADQSGLNPDSSGRLQWKIHLRRPFVQWLLQTYYPDHPRSEFSNNLSNLALAADFSHPRDILRLSFTPISQQSNLYHNLYHFVPLTCGRFALCLT